MRSSPVIVWFRRDLRLSDHPALAAAAATGQPVLPVVVLDEDFGRLGAAASWRLGQGIAALAADIAGAGGTLCVMRGPGTGVIGGLVAQTGATAVFWNRRYAPALVDADKELKAGLASAGVKACSFAANLLAEPWDLRTGAGGAFRVFTPFLRALRARGVATPTGPVARVRWANPVPGGLDAAATGLGRAMNRGAAVVARHAQAGEAAVAAGLAAFLNGGLARYAEARDRLDRDATSHLSAHLALGEIAPARVWWAIEEAARAGNPGAEAFQRQLVWRDFAWHLHFADPDLAIRCWRRDWDGFPWQGATPAFTAWCRGQTGEPVVDAAMRALFVTGRMHNRARMIVASYLTKHLLTDWRLGAGWFADTLVDFDPACNALGWQWVAGCGPDAAPYFRVFNPATQAAKFDPDNAFRRRYLSDRDGGALNAGTAAFFDAVPRAWGLSPGTVPEPLVDLAAGRSSALSAFDGFRHADKA